MTTDEKLAITNNVTLDATSGDATVTGNTKAGNATTGNASTETTIANITNSSLSLTGWFGVLFINIFGNWYGSFGIDTEAGELPTPAQTNGSSTQVLNTNQTNTRVTRVVASSSLSSTTAPDTTQASEDVTEEPQVLSSGIDNTPINTPTAPSYMLQIIGGVLAITLLTGERLYALSQHRKVVG